MTYSKAAPVVNPPKSKNLPLSLAVSFIIILFLLIFQDNATIIPILGFHGVINNKNSVTHLEQGRMHYPQKNLERFLEYLLINDYWFITSQDLYEILSNQNHTNSDLFVKKKPIMISFDDGYRTVYTNLLPVLKKLEKKYGKKVKVVLFINPGVLSKKSNINSTNLSCQELRDGLQQGFYDIQSHGLNHKDLTRLSNKNLIKELLESQNELRKCTHDLDPQQKVASHFAYPYGAYNQRVQKYVSKYYLSGYLYNNKILNRSFLKNQYEIPRLTVNRQESVQDLIEKFDTTFDEKSMKFLDKKLIKKK